MDLEKAFLDAAREEERNFSRRTTALEPERQRLEAQLRQVESEIDAASRARERLASFQPMLGRDYQCPRCWIRFGKQSVMRPLNSTTDDDFFECRICCFEVRISSGI